MVARLIKVSAPGGEPIRGDWRKTVEEWSHALANPHLLVPVRVEDGVLLVRAVDLDPEPPGGAADLQELGRWAAQLADALDAAAGNALPEALGWLCDPDVYLDRGRCVRVGFLPPSPERDASLQILAPEAPATWPRATPRALVYAVGRHVQAWVGQTPLDVNGRFAVSHVLDRCLGRDPRSRFPSLKECADAFLGLAGPPACARSWDAHFVLPIEGEDVGATSRRLAPLRRYDAPVEPVTEVLPLRPPAPLLFPPVEPPRSERPPTPAEDELERGRKLQAGSKLIEARAAFERALVLDPGLAGALVLRREVEKSIMRVRTLVGPVEGAFPTLPSVPAPLVHARDAAAAGDAARAIVEIDRVDPSYKIADSRLLRAACLGFLGRHREALIELDLLAAFEPSRAGDAARARAECLITLGEADHALGLLDSRLGQHPVDEDALYLRAVALDRLGRTEEAAQAFRRFVAVAGSHSDLRVLAARAKLRGQ